ncbi:MAG TPA: L,D-transpeptidase [Solirubrobacteraceae bacterium]|nr:L,D-transpeptidase [Solirubrobacteraceae bacterium]
MNRIHVSTRLVLVALISVAVAPGSVFAADRAARLHQGVRVDQALAVLSSGHLAHKRPAAASPVLADVPATRPITGESTALPVIGHTSTAQGVRWLHVMLPGRPNGTSGWIAAQGTRATATGWHLVVDLARRRVTVYRHGHTLRRFAAVVGKPSTPTPSGDFFVEETLQMSVGEPGGPFALALSARSNALQEFEGGPGQIALHGRDNLGGTLGAAESHGCVRLDTQAIDWLAKRIGPGVPVTIDAR